MVQQQQQQQQQQSSMNTNEQLSHVIAMNNYGVNLLHSGQLVEAYEVFTSLQQQFEEVASHNNSNNNFCASSSSSTTEKNSDNILPQGSKNTSPSSPCPSPPQFQYQWLDCTAVVRGGGTTDGTREESLFRHSSSEHHEAKTTTTNRNIQDNSGLKSFIPFLSIRGIMIQENHNMKQYQQQQQETQEEAKSTSAAATAARATAPSYNNNTMGPLHPPFPSSSSSSSYDGDDGTHGISWAICYNFAMVYNIVGLQLGEEYGGRKLLISSQQAYCKAQDLFSTNNAISGTLEDWLRLILSSSNNQLCLYYEFGMKEEYKECLQAITNLIFHHPQVQQLISHFDQKILLNLVIFSRRNVAAAA